VNGVDGLSRFYTEQRCYCREGSRDELKVMGAAQRIGFEWFAHRHKREAGSASVVHNVLLLFMNLVLIRGTSGAKLMMILRRYEVRLLSCLLPSS
jgi:hypothetical protein